MFRVNIKYGDFIGRDALFTITDYGGSERKIAYFTLEKYIAVYGSEPIMRESRFMDVTSSDNFGYAIGKPVVCGYLPVQEFVNRNFSVEAFGEVIPATRHDGPLYDPEMKKLKL